MDLKKLTDDIVDKETARFGYKGKVSVKKHSTKPCFSGRIDMLTAASIELGYNPEFVEEARALEGIVKEPFTSAFTADVDHELNHKGGNEFKGCPRTIDLHVEKVLEPISETLSGLGFQNVPVSANQTLYTYFANMFNDIFNNAELGNKSDSIGISVIYKDMGIHSDNKRFTPLFDAFIQLQQLLYGGKRSMAMLKEHYSGDSKVKVALDNVMKRTGFSDFKVTKSTRRKKKSFTVLDRQKAMNYFLNEENWPVLSRIITEEFSKLLDKNQMSSPQYVQEMFIPLKGSPDSFEDEMNDPEVMMKFAFKKYLAPGSGKFEPPKYLDCFEALDLVYQRLARNLEIRTNASTRSESMPVMWYGKRQFDPLNDRVARARVEMGREGRLELRVKRYHEDDTIEYTDAIHTIPGIKFQMLDTSSSMQEPVGSYNSGKIMNPWALTTPRNMQWNDNSKYHYALLAWYGLLEFVKKQGALKHTSVKFANYSNSTYTADNLHDSKRLALSPQFGGTSLDLDKVRNMFGRKQLVFSLSDGGIGNWSAIKDEYIKRAKESFYFHFQLGDFVRNQNGNVINQPQMCTDLEDAGLSVIYDDGRNLGKIIIDLTRPYITRSAK